MAARVAWLSIAPVKALGLVHPEAVELGPAGVASDRRFLLLDGDGRLVNGKRHGRLVAVRPEVDESAGTLTLRFPDGSAVSGASREGPPVEAEIYGRRLPARSADGALAEALSAFVGEPLRLLHVEPPATAIDRDARCAVSLLSVASLDVLAARSGREGRVDPRRFRMQIGIDGVEAHAEDGWIGCRVRVGAAVVVPVQPIGRCAVTTHDPDTGVPDLDTLRAIASYRGDGDAGERIPFGVCGRVEEPGRVALGDPIEPLP